MQRRIDNFGKDDATISKQTQTDRGIELKCTECNFEALTNTELSWHMGEVHGWSDDQKNDEIHTRIQGRDIVESVTLKQQMAMNLMDIFGQNMMMMIQMMNQYLVHIVMKVFLR